MQHCHPQGLFHRANCVGCYIPNQGDNVYVGACSVVSNYLPPHGQILLPKKQPDKLQSRGEYEKKYVVGS